MVPNIIWCDYCNKPVDKTGIIRDGKAYHKACWDYARDDVAAEKLQQLTDLFEEIDEEVLNELYDYYNCNAEELKEELSKPWCVIARNGDSIEVVTFSNKSDTAEWITEGALDAMEEGIRWFPLYILNSRGNYYSFDFRIILKHC